MRTRNVLWLLGGSFTVYVAVACAASKGESGPSSSGHDGGVLDAVVDAVKDSLGVGDDAPVNDASAGPGSWSSDPLTCDRAYVAGSPPALAGYKWAEKTYPGRTKEDLARGVAVLCHTGGADTSAPPGYSCAPWPIRVRDGAIAVDCATTNIASLSVTMPPSP